MSRILYNIKTKYTWIPRKPKGAVSYYDGAVSPSNYIWDFYSFTIAWDNKWWASLTYSGLTSRSRFSLAKAYDNLIIDSSCLTVTWYCEFCCFLSFCLNYT